MIMMQNKHKQTFLQYNPNSNPNSKQSVTAGRGEEDQLMQKKYGGEDVYRQTENFLSLK